MSSVHVLPLKNQTLPTESLVLTRNAMLQQLIIQFPPYDLSSGHLRETKNKRNFKLFALEVVAVTYERWSLTRGGRLQEVPNTVI